MAMSQYLLFAFIGGVIMNVMPCVLPVLTLKAFHVAHSLRANPGSARMHGLAYALGTTATFVAFGLIVVALRASGETIGWGMQFQNPAFVAALTALIFLFGLNALGVFELTVSVGGVGDGRGDLYGSVLNGAFAAIMSTPCTAPFLGTAATFAMGTGAQWHETLLLFAAIGLGLAAPFVVLSFVPALIRLMPKPGAWMEVFKTLMGFTLLATAVWLYGVLQTQVEPADANIFLFFLLGLGLAAWLMERYANFSFGFVRRWSIRLALTAAVAASASLLTFEARQTGGGAPKPPTSEHKPVVDNKINWTDFTPEVVAAANARGQSVLMDYTADWCLSCKTLEKTVIETEAVRQTLVEQNIFPVKADWTNENETIEKWLAELGRNAIPTVVVYRPDGTRKVMPVVFGQQALIDALRGG